MGSQCVHRKSGNDGVLTMGVRKARGQEFPKGRWLPDGTKVCVGGPKGIRSHGEEYWVYQVIVRWVSGVSFQGGRSLLCKESYRVMCMGNRLSLRWREG